MSLKERLKSAIRDVPDFPQPGILFKDITPVLKDAGLCKGIVEESRLPAERFTSWYEEDGEAPSQADQGPVNPVEDRVAMTVGVTCASSVSRASRTASITESGPCMRP